VHSTLLEGAVRDGVRTPRFAGKHGVAVAVTDAVDHPAAYILTIIAIYYGMTIK